MILDSDIFVMQTLMVFMESESDRSSSRTLLAANLATRCELHISMKYLSTLIQYNGLVVYNAKHESATSGVTIVLLQSVYVQQLEQQTCL